MSFARSAYFVRVILSLAFFSVSARASDGQPASVELQGRVVCLAEDFNRLYDTTLAATHEHLYGLKAADGTYYTLLKTRYSEALFEDERLRAKDLLLKGWLFPKTQVFEPITIRSIRGGVVYDIYYYCEICAIKSVAPGPCMCCREPVELVEQELTKSSD